MLKFRYFSGLVKIARLALHKHYPKLAQDGFEALFSNPPVIYLTSSTYLETMHYVCRQLGLPQSTIKLLKQPTDLGKIKISNYQV